MYRVKIVKDFSSAHNLREYKGNCENLHGHNWKVEAYLKCVELDSLGMVDDFRNFKRHLKGILDELDHVYINELDYFKVVNPTSENLAKYIFDKLALCYVDKDDNRVSVDKIVVWENFDSAAEYSLS